MQSSFFLFVLIVFVVGVPLEEVCSEAPPLDTVLRFESDPPDHNENLAVDSGPTQWQNDIHRKLSDLNISNVQFNFEDCGNEFSIIKFLKLIILPDPVVTPGQISVSFTIDLKESIVDNLRADVKLTRKIGLLPVKIPCIGSIGSCNYKNLCDKLNLIKECPKPFVENGINCKCPFKKGLISLPLVEFDVRKNMVPSGRYTLHVLLYYKNAFAGCLKLSISFR